MCVSALEIFLYGDAMDSSGRLLESIICAQVFISEEAFIQV